MCAKPENLNDIDSFWDLNELLPKKRPVTPIPRNLNTDTVEVSIESAEKAVIGAPVPKVDTARRLNEIPLRQRAEEYRSKPLDPYLIYKPESRLIKHVEVSAWNNRFNFYENFLTDAKRIWNRTAEKCEHTPFFSYIPQYSQLRYPQMKWYLWWRENVRGGIYLKSDFCYVLLYIYEILNCTDLIPPEAGVVKLCDIWLNYRDDHRRLDRYMVEWLCDYCLINKLPCPTARLKPILAEIGELAALKEFYMDFSDTDGLTDSIFAYSAHDFKNSRYITDENREFFEVHMKGAVTVAASLILSNPEDCDLFGADYRITRVSYESALCAYSAKRSIAVEYTSYTRSPKFRFIATDIVKYCENRIRAALGIRPHLKADGLSAFLKAQLDRYFSVNLPIPKRGTQHTEESAVPAYEKLYEPTATEFSLTHALEIEKESWDTTELLTSAFEEEAIRDKVPEPIQPEVKPAPILQEIPDELDEFHELILSLDEEYTEILRALLVGDKNGFSSVVNRMGALPDGVIDKINEAAFDLIGDVVIEPYGDSYRLIPDYKGEFARWLN